jgi:hypothetical protein
MVLNRSKIKRFLISFFSIFSIILTLTMVFLFFFAYVPGKSIIDQLHFAKDEVNKLQQAIDTKDLELAKIQIEQLHKRTSHIQKKYKNLKVIGSFPYINNFYKDGETILKIAQEGLDTSNIVITAIEPYKDFLGIQGAATDSAKTTQDRISFLTESIEGIIPHFDTIEKKLANIKNYLDTIDASRYPDTFREIPIKSNIYKAKELISTAHKIIKDGQPIISKTAWLLGNEKPINYFVIFQNDAELRPTGGFWTAYAIIKVDKGKVTPIISEDIYSLDARLNSKIPAPRPIKSYHIDVPYFNLRDMNISPDFPTSIELFLEHYQKIASKKNQIDAVIAIDTQVLVDMVKVLGRIGVGGYGNFSADPDKRCDGCPQIIYQLQWITGRPRNYIEANRKGVLGPLMNSLLANAMGSEKEKIGPLVTGVFKNINEKHMMFYFLDPELQKAGELANIAGKINSTDSDYFALIDANMSSAKTNLFLRQKIKHEIITKNNQVEHKFTITYINPSKASNCNLEKGDLCLNAPKYRNWFRFYLPKNSKLVKMTGSEIEALQYEELDKQVFEGFYGNKFPLYAKSSLMTSIQYISSVPASKNYSILIQKQAGTKPVEYNLYVNGKKFDSFVWVADKTIKLDL